MFKNVTGCSVIIAAMLFAMACSTSIKTGPLSRITITPEKGRVYVGQSINLAARGYDDKGNMIKVSPNWRIINSKTGVLNKK